ncbi:MAG: hypothetical protein ACTS27_05835, partial [Phycisphaerales bacterium]
SARKSRLRLDSEGRDGVSSAQMRTSLNNDVESSRDDLSEPRRGRAARWVARFGVAGFLFFLIKGLAWLIVPAAIAAYAAKS